MIIARLIWPEVVLVVFTGEVGSDSENTYRASTVPTIFAKSNLPWPRFINLPLALSASLILLIPTLLLCFVPFPPSPIPVGAYPTWKHRLDHIQLVPTSHWHLLTPLLSILDGNVSVYIVRFSNRSTQSMFLRAESWAARRDIRPLECLPTVTIVIFHWNHMRYLHSPVCWRAQEDSLMKVVKVLAVRIWRICLVDLVVLFPDHQTCFQSGG